MLSGLAVLVVSTVITAAEPGDYFRMNVEDEDKVCRIPTVTPIRHVRDEGNCG
jgi:hypothetical protein